MRERIKAPPAEEVVEYLFRPRALTSPGRDFRILLRINRAHVVMLVRQDLMTPEHGAALLHVLSELEADGVESLPFDPGLEDAYLNMEHAIIQKVGSDTGGRLHTGRSRNDIYATMTRIAVREAMPSLAAPLLSFINLLLNKADEHLDTVMPGYTHLQPAQPTTMGHYLGSVAMALERDAQRLLTVYPRLNLSPMGACAFAGTGFPIDRTLMARLLGFDRVMQSTLDAVASRDYVSELLSATATMGVTLSRLAQDLYLWCTNEWSAVEVADEVAMTSSIMPQKKNPVTLEYIKSGAGALTGALVSSLTVQKGVNFMHCQDMSHEAIAPVWDALDKGTAMLRLAHRTIDGLTSDRQRLLQRARQDFCTATELADLMVRDKGLPFREAHGIVGNLVNEVLQQGTPWDEVDAAAIDGVALRISGRELDLTDEQVSGCLDPVRNVEGKTTPGSPGPEPTKALIAEGRRALAGHHEALAAWADRDRQSHDELAQAVTDLSA